MLASQRFQLKRSLITGLTIGASVLGIFALTNPNRSYYELYVTDVLSDYLIDRVCLRFPQIAASCQELILTHQQDLLEVVQHKTTRVNFIVFSSYKTEIELPVVPMVRIRAIGILARLYPYDVEFPDGTNEL